MSICLTKTRTLRQMNAELNNKFQLSQTQLAPCTSTEADKVTDKESGTEVELSQERLRSSYDFFHSLLYCIC